MLSDLSEVEKKVKDSLNGVKKLTEVELLELIAQLLVEVVRNQ